MSRICIHKLAQIFQQVLPGMFQESGVDEITVPRDKDREGNLYWPCFYCHNPVRDEEGLYVTDEDDVENFERYLQYEETLSDEDTMSAEKLVDARMASDEFYNQVRGVVQSIITDINALSEEDLKEATRWSMKDSEIEDKFKRIGIYYRNMLNKIGFLFDKHYYYNQPEIYTHLLEVKRSLSDQYGYWPRMGTGALHNYYWGATQNIKSQLYQDVTTILNEAAERYRIVRDVITSASQAAGTKKHLIQRHIIKHPVCDRCHEQHGSECYVPECNFTSSDMDDFHKVKIKHFDENTNKHYTDEQLFCDEHGFKCDSCGEEFVKDPYEVFGTHGDDTYGYGAREADGDLYCDNCFTEIFDYCQTCNEPFFREDLIYDEKSEEFICPQCHGGGTRQSGVEGQLSSDELEGAHRFAHNTMGVGNVGYPIDVKAIDTQILPALRKIRNKQFKSYEQWKSWLMKRIQSKDAKAAVLSELMSYMENIDDWSDEEFEQSQRVFNEQLIKAFTLQSDKAHVMLEKYPGLRGYKPLDVVVKIEKTPGHRGHSFAIYPSERLLNYADVVMPGAREAYDRILKHRGHHRGALAYARFSKSNGKIVVDNLQTDLDSQALQYEMRDGKATKPLQWWLTAIKKFWAPFMLNLLRQYGEKTNQKVYLTSYKMQKNKWRTLPERNKDIYERTPDTMGFRRKTVDVKPEDLTRQEYKMRRLAEFVNMFCKLAKIESLPNLKELVGKMFAVDSDLTPEGANWNHNLADVLKILVRVAKKPRKLEAVLERFDPEDWIKRGEEPLKEIAKLDEQLARDINAILYAMLMNPNFKDNLPSLIVQQPCKHCGIETSGNAFVRLEDGRESVLCESCAVKQDRKDMSTSEFLERWAPGYKCEQCGYDGSEPEVGGKCPMCGGVGGNDETLLRG